MHKTSVLYALLVACSIADLLCSAELHWEGCDSYSGVAVIETGMEYCQIRSCTFDTPSQGDHRSPPSLSSVAPLTTPIYTPLIALNKLLWSLDSILYKILLLCLLRVVFRCGNPVELYVALSALFHSLTLSQAVTTGPSSTTTGSPTGSALISQYKRGECDAGWVQMNSSCYYPSREKKSFDRAQRACSYHAASLVTITSPEENSLVFNIARDFLVTPEDTPVWIGMERAQLSSTSQTLQWTDGTPIHYTNWIIGEPDSNGACVQMILNGLWEDSSCLQTLMFICKKPSSFPPPYSRSTELAVMVGIPLSFAVIVISVVSFLVLKSMRDADGTFFGYGKNRNKERMHAAIVDVTASVAHIRAQRGFNAEDYQSPSKSSTKSRSHSIASSQNNNHTNPKPGTSSDRSPDISPGSPERREFAQVTGPRIEIEEDPERIEIQICASSTSIEQDPSRFQSTTSLDYLVSKSFITPKTRKLKGIQKLEATVRPAGKHGIYRKKDSFNRGSFTKGSSKKPSLT